MVTDIPELMELYHKKKTNVSSKQKSHLKGWGIEAQSSDLKEVPYPTNIQKRCVVGKENCEKEM